MPGRRVHMIDDLERIYDELFAETGWAEIYVALLVVIATWPVALFCGWIVKELLLKIPGASVGLATIAKNSTRVLVVVIGAAAALMVLNVGPGFIMVVIVGLGIMGAVLVQPLVRNIGAGSALPFLVGDQIVTHGYEGTVIDINLRQTVVKTLDRRVIYVPHSEVLANPIVVHTKLEQRRSSLRVWTDYGTDIDDACQLLVATVSALPGVDDDPAPYVIPGGFEDGRCELVLKYFHASDLHTEERMRGEVVTAIKSALDKAGIAISPPAAIFISQPG